MKHWLYYAFGCVWLSLCTWYWRRRAKRIESKSAVIEVNFHTLQDRERINRELNLEKQKRDKERSQNVSTVVDIRDAWHELRERDKNH